eukprot:GHVP01029647.1.p1 GENE.GHVP01029647.1~~GHVP01029647.1.p1  ORF type:complete len:129 (+),score=17.92 GHVP01029647.1:7-393(+)
MSSILPVVSVLAHLLPRGQQNETKWHCNFSFNWKDDWISVVVQKNPEKVEIWENCQQDDDDFPNRYAALAFCINIISSKPDVQDSNRFTCEYIPLQNQHSIASELDLCSSLDFGRFMMKRKFLFLQTN